MVSLTKAGLPVATPLEAKEFSSIDMTPVIISIPWDYQRKVLLKISLLYKVMALYSEQIADQRLQSNVKNQGMNLAESSENIRQIDGDDDNLIPAIIKVSYTAGAAQQARRILEQRWLNLQDTLRCREMRRRINSLGQIFPVGSPTRHQITQIHILDWTTVHTANGQAIELRKWI